MASFVVKERPSSVDQEADIVLTGLLAGDVVSHGRFQILETLSLPAYTLPTTEQNTGSTHALPAAEIFRAHDEFEDSEVALKIYHTPNERAEAAVYRERSAYAVLHGKPGIIDYHGMGTLLIKGRLHHYIALDPAHDGNFYEELRKPHQLNKTLRAMLQIAIGLEAIHGEGLIHGDMKPENVLRDGDEHKISDFELARASTLLQSAELVSALGSSVLWQSLTDDERTIMGSVGYIAPEQYTLGSEIGPAIDISPFGAIGYLAFGGRLPYDSSSAALYSYAALNEAPVPLHILNEAVPIQLSDLLHDCLAKDPRERPTSTKVKEGLQSVMEAGVEDVVLDPVSPTGANIKTVATYLDGW